MMDASKYRKKPVEIEAMQWDGSTESATQIINWILDSGGTARFIGPFEPHPLRREGENLSRPAFIVIDTLEGMHRTDAFDQVIKGIQREFYPCKPDIFEATYEKV